MPRTVRVAIGLAAAILASQLLSASALAQATCFGAGTVLTCLDQAGGPAFQVNCFGTKYKTCFGQGGQQLTPSVVTGDSGGATAAASSKLEFNSPATPGQQQSGAAAPARPSADPAFGSPGGAKGR